jgi:hypothetical protein
VWHRWYQFERIVAFQEHVLQAVPLVAVPFFIITFLTTASFQLFTMGAGQSQFYACCRTNDAAVTVFEKAKQKPNKAKDISTISTTTPSYLTPIHTPKSKLVVESLNELPQTSWTPSESTAAETEDSSPAGTLSSLYLASPLATVIVEEEENPEQPSDEEDSVYETNDVPLDEFAGTLRKFRTSFVPRPTHIDDLPPPKADQCINDDALAHFKQLKLQAKLLKKSKKKQKKHKQYEDRVQDVQSYRQLWTDFQDIENEVSSIDSAHPPPPPNEEYQGLTEMYFDFNSFDFGHMDLNDDDDASQVSQSNLSLLSEQSLEAQRRYYKEKKKRKKRKKKSFSAASSKSSACESVSSIGSKDYGPVRRLPQPVYIEETVLKEMEVTVPEVTESRNVDCDNASYVSDLEDDSTVASNTSSMYDYGVPRRRLRSTPTGRHTTPSTLQSKLDSLENKVAGLQETKSGIMENIHHATETIDTLEENSAKEHLVILDFVPSLEGFSPCKDFSYVNNEPVSETIESVCRPTTSSKRRMDFQPEYKVSSLSSSPELLLEIAQKTLSKGRTSSYDTNQSFQELSPSSKYQRDNDSRDDELLQPPIPLSIASSAHGGDITDSKLSNDPPGTYTVQYDEVNYSHDLVNASSGDESDFAGFRSMSSNAGVSRSAKPAKFKQTSPLHELKKHQQEEMPSKKTGQGHDIDAAKGHVECAQEELHTKLLLVPPVSPTHDETERKDSDGDLDLHLTSDLEESKSRLFGSESTVSSAQ